MIKFNFLKLFLFSFLCLSVMSAAQVVTIKDGFTSPKKVTLDSGGNIYILDGNDVKKMDANGSNLVTIGTVANNASYDFARDSSGNFYIVGADNDGFGVKKMNSTGIVSPFANFPNDQDQGALGVAVDASNNVYVAHSENNEIIKYSPSETELAKYTNLNQPSAITVVGGYIYAGVLDNNFTTYSIVKINPSNSSVTTIKSGLPSLPFSIAVDITGNIYYVEYGGGIKKMSSTGTNVTAIGSGFNFSQNGGITLDSAGNLYIADTGNGAIKKISAVNLGTTNPDKSNTVNISPNPAKDFAVLNNVTKGAKIGLYDTTGKLLYQTEATGTSLTLNTSAYKNGLYLVKVDGKAFKLLISK